VSAHHRAEHREADAPSRDGSAQGSSNELLRALDEGDRRVATAIRRGGASHARPEIVAQAEVDAWRSVVVRARCMVRRHRPERRLGLYRRVPIGA